MAEQWALHVSNLPRAVLLYMKQVFLQYQFVQVTSRMVEHMFDNFVPKSIELIEKRM